jgi:hypothetical protein
MPDRIYATYSHAVSGYSIFFHATIHYERTDSQGNVMVHKVIEGAPQNSNLTTQQKYDATTEEYFRTDNGPSAFGNIVAHVDPNAPLAKPTTPYEVIAVGADLTSNWSNMEQYVTPFNNAGYAYRGVGQNSNTFASAALAAGNLRPATGVAVDPTIGGVVVHWTPGLKPTLE